MARPRRYASARNEGEKDDGIKGENKETQTRSSSERSRESDIRLRGTSNYTRADGQGACKNLGLMRFVGVLLFFLLVTEIACARAVGAD